MMTLFIDQCARLVDKYINLCMLHVHESYHERIIVLSLDGTRGLWIKCIIDRRRYRMYKAEHMQACFGGATVCSHDYS